MPNGLHMEITIKREMYRLILMHSLKHLMGYKHLLITREYITKYKSCWIVVPFYHWFGGRNFINGFHDYSWDTIMEKVGYLRELHHFLNGALAGIAFQYITSFITSSSFSLTTLSYCLFGILYGILLWIVTLVPVHKPITGFPPWNHPLGHLPVFASLSGH